MSGEWIVTRTGTMRLEAISFFLVAFLLSAAGVRWIWNTFARDFPRLPRLTYRGALAALLLWGLAFGLVLTMISGARELMTPGAWKRKGATYALADGVAPDERSTEAGSDPLAARRTRLRDLRFPLWDHAARHDGRFPASLKEAGIPDEARHVDDSSRMDFRYRGGLTIHDDAILVMEPDIFVATNTILTGEIKDGVRPWGNPLHWRDPERGINTSADSFGSPFLRGCQFLMVDGAVRTVNPKVAPEVLRALARPNDGAIPDPSDLE